MLQHREPPHNLAAEESVLGALLLRHSVASVAIAEGHDVAAVSEMLGHANSNATLTVYTHAFDRTKAAATATVANAVGAW